MKLKLLIVDDEKPLRDMLARWFAKAYDCLTAPDAGEAMKDGGSISIALGSDDRDVFLSIRDNGSGMDAEQLVTLFEPYRTTKEKGTGLGLMISKRIVTEHGGSIAAESKPGEGTTFTLALPRLEQRIRALK